MEEIIKQTKDNVEAFLKDDMEHQNKNIDYILVNAETKETITLASDKKEEIIQFAPYTTKENGYVKGYMIIPDWDFNFDTYLFEELQKGYEIGYISDDCHYGVWQVIEEWYPEEFENIKGIQKYLRYCKDNGITKEYLNNKIGLNPKDIMQYYEENYNIKEKDLESERAYFTFVLGYDVLQDMLKKFIAPNRDLFYDFCDYEAGRFLESKEYRNPKHSGYEMLNEWVNKNKEQIIEDFKEMTGSEVDLYNGNMRIVERGYRDKKPIALIEKIIGNEKEYIIAFYYTTKKDKLEWAYGYYYDNDRTKAFNDFEKVIFGGNLANTFDERKDR